jgi:tetratricopeptide (TPR) repeat protein
MKKFCGIVAVFSMTVGASIPVWASSQQGARSEGSQQQQRGAQSQPQGQPGQQSGQAGQQGGQGSSAPQITPAEGEAFKAIQNELDADRKIQMINDFEKKYPNSAALPYVYLVAADTYRQKGDAQHVIEYGEKSLKLKGDNAVALIMVASLLPEPQSLRGSDADKEKKLAEAEDYATRAIKLVDQAQIPRQPNMTDDQFKKSKAQLASWAHSSLGMVHLQRASMGLTGMDPGELTSAEKEYEAAVSITDTPTPADYFRLAEAYRSHGKVDEAIQAFSKASELDESGAIKSLADKAAEELKSKKAAAKPPAKP